MQNPGAFTQKKPNFFKRNLVQTLEIITPDIYFDEDRALSGLEVDPVSQLINTHVLAANDITNVLNVSALADTTLSSINNISGISAYFIKQNNLTNISPEDFEREILNPLGKSFRDYATSAAFKAYVDDELLFSIRTNTPSATFSSDLDPSAAHVHLVSSLSWMYFLNTSADGQLDFNPSSYVSDQFVEKLYRGKSINLTDGIKGFEEYIFRNYEVCTTWQTLLPTDFVSGAGQYVSGTQNLDKLKTLIDVAYSPLRVDATDTRVREAMEDYMVNKLLLVDEVSKGPFYRLLKAFSYLIADVKDQVDTIGVMDDILECPVKLLPLLADLIGWELFGHDPERWRIQLINAVDIYKRTGTKKSIQVAVNSIFPRDSFDVSSSIQELWESYIPNLIYYALATESSLLESTDTWTLKIAKGMGVDTFSPSSIDENLKICVDNILLSLVKEFPKSFIVGRKPFPVGDPSFKFRYRGRVFDIPPFEEIPYYIKSDINELIILRITDLLVCFGVRQKFAEEVGSYIRTNTILATDDIRQGNSWLIFTSGSQVPPNFNEVMYEISKGKDKYLGLWNGKSSHYRLDFETEDFNFSKNTLEIDSGLAIVEASRVADSFAPAHAIRDTHLHLTSTDGLTPSGVLPAYIVFDNSKNASAGPGIWGGYNSSGSGRFMPGYGVSGHAMAGYKRNTKGIAGSGIPFQREEVDTVMDPLLSGTSGAGDVLLNPRFTLRRRNYHNTLIKEGLYTRSGHNMPIGWDTSTLELSLVSSVEGEFSTSSIGFLPLGFIPSSCTFVPIDDYRNLPDIYSRCQTLDASTIFNGVPTSSTFPCRGLSALGSDEKNTQFPNAHANYVDRGQLDPFIATMHSIDSQKEILVSSSDLSGIDLEDYTFGRGVHRLYKDYTTKYNRHFMSKRVIETDGVNIFSHTFGPYFENADMQDNGSQAITFTEFRASSVSGGDSATIFCVSGTGLSSLGHRAVTSRFITSGLSAAPNDERRLADIINGVEYVIQEVSSINDGITLYDLGGTANSKSYADNNPLVKIKNVDGFNRLVFDLRNYLDQNNFMIPDHKFKINIKALIGNEDVSKIGGAKIGIWIHTDQENVNERSDPLDPDVSSGLIWSYTPQGKWIMHDSHNLTRDYILGSLTHTFDSKLLSREVPKDVSSGINFNCISSVTPIVATRNHAVVPTYREEEFKDLEIIINTKNSVISVPEVYFKFNSQVHRTNQNYRIEVFILPSHSNKDKYVLIDSVTMQDMTQKERIEIEVSGAINSTNPFKTFCSSLTVDLTKDQLRSIIIQFNNMAGAHSKVGLNSRVAANTSSIMEVSGGSRINYRDNPDWPGIGSYIFTFAGSPIHLSSLDRFSNIAVVN